MVILSFFFKTRVIRLTSIYQNYGQFWIKIRALIPESFLLIPGVGSQGGDINKVVKNLTKTSKNILINVSRAIIYASNSKEYLDEAEKSVDYFNSQIGFK